MSEWLSIAEAAKFAQVDEAALVSMLDGRIIPTDGTLRASVSCLLGVYVRSMAMPARGRLIRNVADQNSAVTHVLAQDFDAWLASRSAELLADGLRSPQCGAIEPDSGRICDLLAGHELPHRAGAAIGAGRDYWL